VQFGALSTVGRKGLARVFGRKGDIGSPWKGQWEWPRPQYGWVRGGWMRKAEARSRA
jgi:hypothetical protein